jgi:hypothetical protein
MLLRSGPRLGSSRRRLHLQQHQQQRVDLQLAGAAPSATLTSAHRPGLLFLC